MSDYVITTVGGWPESDSDEQGCVSITSSDTH